MAKYRFVMFCSYVRLIKILLLFVLLGFLKNGPALWKKNCMEMKRNPLFFISPNEFPHHTSHLQTLPPYRWGWVLMLVKCYHPQVTVISKFGRHSVPPQLGRTYGVAVISSVVRSCQCCQLWGCLWVPLICCFVVLDVFWLLKKGWGLLNGWCSLDREGTWRCLYTEFNCCFFLMLVEIWSFSVRKSIVA